MMAKSIIPDFPLFSAIGPFAEEVNQQTIEWAYRFNLAQYVPSNWLEKSNFGMMGVRLYPNATYEKQCLAGDYFTWLFVLDDLCDRASANNVDTSQLFVLLQEVSEILKTGKSADQQGKPILLSLTNILNRAETFGTPQSLREFKESLSLFLEEATWQTNLQIQGYIPSLTEYLEIRPKSGFYITFSLVLLFDEINLPDKIFKHEIVQSLRLLINLAGCMANDLHSADIEKQLVTSLNLAFVLQKELNLTFEEAVKETFIRYEQNLATIKTIYEYLSFFFNKDAALLLKKYFNSLFLVIKGYIDWAVIDTKRYAGA